MIYVSLYREGQCALYRVKALWPDVVNYLSYYDAVTRRVHVSCEAGSIIVVDIIEA